MTTEVKNPILLNYKIKKVIGKGTFSIVKLAIDKETGKKIAIKILEKDKIKNKRDMNRIERELSMVKKIDHPNIAKVYDIKEDENKYYIIMEYCENGELFNLILEKHKLSEEESAYYYFQIINGLEYIHYNNIIHRDLKPENLLLTKNNILKIIDFGLSNYNTDDNLLSTPCGSPCYASPEMVSGEKYNGFTSDIWSTGIILYAMIYGYLPFENINNNNDILFQKITECKVDYPRNSCIFALDLLKKILVPNSKERIKIDDIKKHKFYIKGKSIFHHKHKELNLYKSVELNKENISLNNIMNKDNDSIDNKIFIENNSLDKINNNVNQKDEYKNCNDSDIFDNENQEINDKNKKYKNKEKKNINKNSIKEKIKKKSPKKLLHSSHKYPDEERKQKMINIDDEYFLNINTNDNRRTSYCIQKKNDIDFNITNANTDIPNKNDFILSPTIKKNNELLGIKGEKKKESRNAKKAKTKKNKNKIITNSLPDSNSNDNKNKSLKTELIPTCQDSISELKNQKKIHFSDKFLDLNALSIERGNGYYYKALSKITKTSPLNIYNNKDIVINLEDENIENNNKIKKRANDDIIKNNEYKSNFIINTENYSNQNKFSKNRNIKLNNDNNYNLGIKKYSVSVQKNNTFLEKNKLLSKIRMNNIIREKGDEPKDEAKNSLDESNRTKTNEIKKLGFSQYSKLITNPKIVIKPISIINYKENNSFIISTPDKKGLNLEFLKRNKLNKDNYGKNVTIENYSFCSDIKQSNKNYSFLNDNQTNEAKLTCKKESLDNKNKNIKNKRRRYKPRDEFISSETKVEVNNNVLYSSNYRNKHTINKSSLGDNYFKKNLDNFKKKNKNTFNNDNNIENNDNDNNMENNQKIEEINNRNTNNFNNNYIKIISNSKKDINSQKVKKKLSSSAYNESCLEPTNNNINNDILIHVRRIMDDYRKEPKDRRNLEQEEMIKNMEIEKNNIYKDKKGNLRLSINKINNKVSDGSITKLNNTNKALNTNNIKKDYYLRYGINEKGEDLYKTERNGHSINHQTYTYIQKMDENDLSNKYFNEEKHNNSFKSKILNGDKKIDEYKINNNNSCEKDNNKDKNKNKWSTYFINNISKINISSLPSITIDMNILNKNNKKYLKFYDAIKNKL